MPFNKKLVLNQYLLSLFGETEFTELASRVNRPGDEGLDADNVSKMCHALLNIPGRRVKLGDNALLEYDRNIVAHTQEMQVRRPAITWKYFQYLALLFTEIYLDRYMNYRDGLLSELNEQLRRFNKGATKKDRLLAFTENDLRRIAFWSATGSGKTLIMHVNIKQFIHYLCKAGRRRQISRILLVTPNEGLSRQHLDEMRNSGIQASMFAKDGSSLFSGHGVEIIEITKLAEKAGEKTVAIDSFEHNNLVLTDEAHRGSSGDVWGRYRKKLARDGFTIEYSATLGQAAANNRGLETQYAKSILFDYSYRHFHGDGFGKNYRILNLPAIDNDDTREMYLTACMLSFYQQKLLFGDKATKAKKFNLENPLCVFVGSSVNAVRIQNRRQVSDVVDVLLFLARLTSTENRKEVIGRIERIRNGKASLISESGDVFAGMFSFTSGRRRSAERLYKDMLKKVFNANASAGLHVEELKGADGEIALRLGNNEPFGVVNVGDAPRLCKLCAQHEKELIVSSRSFTGSLFRDINEPNSTINLLIGSKRFSEGWNSWRVSTMGLLNVGQKEGTQVIQLFGRGVRLWGLGRGLKRHTALVDQVMEKNDRLDICETLNVFGVRSNYMEQFKQYLENDGISAGDSFQEILWPVQTKLPGKNKLKTIKVTEGLDFLRDGGKHELHLLPGSRLATVVLDYYPRIEVNLAEELEVDEGSIPKEGEIFQPEHLAMLDFDAIYLELQELKKERGWFNLCLSKAEIKNILENSSWYQILIPSESLGFDSFERVAFWQGIASALLRKYCDRFYKVSKSAWEAPRRKYAWLAADDPSLAFKYRILVRSKKKALIKEIKAAKSAAARLLKSGKPWDGFIQESFEAIQFDQHLYQPIIAIKNSDIKVTPAPLNSGEAKFVHSLKDYLRQNPALEGEELYLLRNMSRGKGVGFFDAGNFYPDFILWLLRGDKQHINFVDPKGIQHLSSHNDPKVEFHKTIKEIEREMGDENVHLNAFIISVTPSSAMSKKWTDWKLDDYLARNILFQQKGNHMDQMFKVIRGK